MVIHDLINLKSKVNHDLMKTFLKSNTIVVLKIEGQDKI